MKMFILAACTLVVLSACGEKEDPTKIVASGTVEAIEIKVPAKVPAQILTVDVEEGDRVLAGETVATLDHASLDIQLREAEAVLAAARSQAALVRSGARKEDVRQAETVLAQAEVQRGLAEDELRRQRSLLGDLATTRSVFEASEARLAVEVARVESAKAALQKVRTFARAEDVATADARVRQAEATRDRMSKLIADCIVSAPSPGIVTHRVVEPGEMAGMGSTVIMLTDLSKMYLTLYVTEAELARVRVGQSVNVRIDGAPEKTFRGIVVYIAPEAEFTPKNIQTKNDRVKLVFGVKVEIDNVSGALKAGMPADAEIVAPPL